MAFHAQFCDNPTNPIASHPGPPGEHGPTIKPVAQSLATERQIEQRGGAHARRDQRQARQVRSRPGPQST
jgi:hypothetical protein